VPNYPVLRKRDGFAGRSFKFQKRSQLFAGVHNETLCAVAMCVCNPDYRISVAAGVDRGSLKTQSKTALRSLVQVLGLPVFDSQQN
jgi:hypothetical protein